MYFVDGLVSSLLLITISLSLSLSSHKTRGIINNQSNQHSQSTTSVLSGLSRLCLSSPVPSRPIRLPGCKTKTTINIAHPTLPYTTHHTIHTLPSIRYVGMPWIWGLDLLFVFLSFLFVSRSQSLEVLICPQWCLFMPVPFHPPNLPPGLLLFCSHRSCRCPAENPWQRFPNAKAPQGPGTCPIMLLIPRAVVEPAWNYGRRTSDDPFRHFLSCQKPKIQATHLVDTQAHQVSP